MEFQMRNKTFISSMVGVAAAVAVAGSANAGFIDAFTVAGMGVNPQPGSPFQWRSFAGVGTAAVDATNYTLAMSRSAGQQLLVQWSNNTTNEGVTPGTGLNWTGLQSISFTITSTTGGALDLTVASRDADDSATNRRLRWQNFTIGTGITNVTLNVGSAYGGGTFEQNANFDVSAVNFVSLRSFGTGDFGAEVSNFQYNMVPAPGALALLGVAGIVGARRRRA
jgi:hypothetical protein